MKKNKKQPVEVNFTVDCEVTQTSPAPVRPIYCDFWDTVDLTFRMQMSGSVLDLRNDPEFRRKVKDRMSERVDELFDAVHVSE